MISKLVEKKNHQYRTYKVSGNVVSMITIIIIIIRMRITLFRENIFTQHQYEIKTC